jgi:cytochrome c553
MWSLKKRSAFEVDGKWMMSRAGLLTSMLLTLAGVAAWQPPSATRADAPVLPKGTLAAGDAKPSTPTYYRDVRPIMVAHCVSCHASGRVAPFALDTYHQVEKRSAQIAQMTANGMMPPWKADSHGDIVGENRLSAADVTVLRNWVDAGAPEGNVKAARPQPRRGDSSVALGKPDIVLTPKAPCHIPADGPDFYRCYVLPTHFTDDKYLSAIVFEPENPSVADHALEYFDRAHRIRFLNQVGGGGSFIVDRSTNGLDPAMVVGGWGISTPPQRFPAGYGMLLPKGADIIVQVHYHATGKPETDKPRLCLYFCRKPVKPIHVVPLLGQNLRMHTQYSRISFGGQSPVLRNMSVVSVLPYMHRRGQSIMVTALQPDKKADPILSVPQWDFDWVGDYAFRKPVHVPAGSILALTASFDTYLGGSPPETDSVITWGDRPDDENAVAYVFYTSDSGKAVPDPGPPTSAGMRRLLLKMFDANHDGVLDKQERRHMSSYFGGIMPAMAGMEM